MSNYNHTKQILLSKAFISFNIFTYSSLLLPVTTLSTLIGNSLCISALLINRRKWLKHHFYMFLMCFSDSFVLLYMIQYLFLHVGLYALTFEKFYLPYQSTTRSYCKFVYALGLIGNSCSFTLTLCLAFDRLHALYYPFKYRILSLSYAIKVGCILTLINISLSIFFVTYIELYTITTLFNTKLKFCWINPITTPTFLYLTLSSIYTMYYQGLIPVCLLFILNAFLSYKTVNIIKSSKNVKSSRHQYTKGLKSVALSSLTIILLSTLYIGCISPLSVISQLINIREVHPVYNDSYLHYIDQTGLACNGWTAEILVSYSYDYTVVQVLFTKVSVIVD